MGADIRKDTHFTFTFSEDIQTIVCACAFPAIDAREFEAGRKSNRIFFERTEIDHIGVFPPAQRRREQIANGRNSDHRTDQAADHSSRSFDEFAPTDFLVTHESLLTREPALLEFPFKDAGCRVHINDRQGQLGSAFKNGCTILYRWKDKLALNMMP